MLSRCDPSESPSNEMLHDFKNHPDEQASSTLLQLPTEIRLKILRMLMKKSKPIPSRLGSGYARDYLDELALSSQVLRCCQVLYAEGLNILYNENTLSITCQHAGVGCINCGVLHTIISVYHVLEYLGPSIHDVDLLTVAKHKMRKTLPAGRHKDVLDFISCYNSFTRFKRIQLSFECGDVEYDAVSVLLVRLLVMGKEVTISQLPSSFNYHALKFLRCSSVNISRDNAPEDIDEIISLATGSEPVEDIIEPWLNLLHTTHSLQSKNRNLFDWEFVDELRELHRAISRFDKLLVEKLTRHIVKLGLEWNAECADLKLGWSLDQYELLERKLIACLLKDADRVTRYLT